MNRLFTTTATSDEEEADTTSGSDAREDAASDREHHRDATAGDDTGTVEDADSDTTSDVEEEESTTTTASSEKEDVVAIDLFEREPDTNPVEDVEDRDDPELDAGQDVEEPEQPASYEATYPNKPRASYLPSEMRDAVEDEGASPASTLTAGHVDDAARRIAACDQQACTLINEDEHARLLYERAGSEPGHVWAVPVTIWRRLSKNTLFPNEKRAARNAHARAASTIAEKAEQTPAWTAATDVDADNLATVLKADDWAVLVL